MKHKHGVTLLEIILAMALTSIVLAAVYTVFLNSFRLNEDQTNYVQAQDALRIASLRIEQDIRSSSQNISIDRDHNRITIVDHSESGNFSDVEYYLDSDNVLFRDGLRVSDRIVSLEISNPYDRELEANDETIVDVVIKSDFDGEVIVHEQRIYLRSPQR